MHFPTIKSEKTTGKLCAFNQTLTFTVADKFSEKTAKLCSLFMPYISFSCQENGILAITQDDMLLPESYRLTIRSDKILISYRDYLGIRNALATLSVKMQFQDNTVILPELEIYDAPDFSHRGVMLDTGRGVMPLPRLSYDLILAAKAKMNIFHFHLVDGQGLSVCLESLPESMRLEGCYSKVQVAELCALCEVLGLEIIPEFDMPAHSETIIANDPSLRCESSEAANYPDWVICIGNEHTYELYEHVIAELCTLFPNGRYFHIGGDELEFADLTPQYLCHWMSCKRCRALMETEGLTDRQELFYHFVNRINAMVKSHGRQMIMWSDQLDCARPVTIDKDVIMNFWRIAYPGRGPYENCSLQRQLELGYTVINAHYPETYVDLEGYMSSKTLADWSPYKRPESAPAYQNAIIGSEVNAWEYGNLVNYPHYAHSLPSAVLLMGDKLWSATDKTYDDEYAEGMTRTLLGQRTPEGLNVFSAIGDVFPPRTGEKVYRDQISITKEQQTAIIEVLSDTARFTQGDAFRAAVYKDCVESYTL